MDNIVIRLGVVLVVIGGLAVAGTLAQTADDAAEDDARPDAVVATDAADMAVTVIALTGSAMTRPDPDAPWTPLAVDDTLAVGAEVRTGLRSSIDLTVGPNAEVTIDRLSHVTIGELARDADTQTLRTKLAVKFGKVDFHVRHVGFVNDFRIASPTDVVAVRGTRGSLSTYGGPAEIRGHRGNRHRAIGGRTRGGDASYDLTDNQSVDDETRDPHETHESQGDPSNRLAGANRSDFRTRQIINTTGMMQSMRGYDSYSRDRDRFTDMSRDYRDKGNGHDNGYYYYCD